MVELADALASGASGVKPMGVRIPPSALYLTKGFEPSARLLASLNQKMKRNNHNRGFTLLELMVVVIILSLLAMLALPRFFGRVDDARITTVRVQIQSLETAIRLFYLDTGFYPTTEQGLKALVEKPGDAKNWREGGYLEKGMVPKDSWGNDYIYRSPGESGREYEISSLGRDGKEGGSGVDADIKSWETPQ